MKVPEFCFEEKRVLGHTTFWIVDEFIWRMTYKLKQKPKTLICEKYLSQKKRFNGL